MVFRSGGRKEDVQEEQEDGLNIISEDDEEEYVASYDIFAVGQRCDVCRREEGRIGIDPTCRATYDGDPVLVCYDCSERELARVYEGIEGAAVIVAPFGRFPAHYYYRLDELPAYQFVREDTEAISWLMLTIGGPCTRCGQQSHFAWLTRDFVDERLPENRQIFRNLDQDIEHLCNACAAASLNEEYQALELPLVTVELPRGAMGILMPTGE